MESKLHGRGLAVDGNIIALIEWDRIKADTDTDRVVGGVAGDPEEL